ncbi:MAG: cation:proton antiporter [Deltaproteobacteria bacterium]|nr:cation:proton antiporter [Deltaproteobacteria bacterium]
MVETIINISMGLIILAGLLGSVRFFIGPSIYDRVIALDVLTIISISLIALLSHVAGRALFLDIAIVYGLLSFIAVLAISRYLERGL